MRRPQASPTLMLRVWFVVAVLLCTALAAQDPPPSTATRQVTVPLHDGAVRVDELVRALATAYELDPAGLTLPAVSLDLDGAGGGVALFAARKLLFDTVRFRRPRGGHQLVVTIDRERARDVRRDLRARLARVAARLGGADAAERRYDLALPRSLDGGRPLVVLVHGVESSAAALDELRDYLAAPPRGHQVATFEYPDDESIDTIAAEFAAKLRALGGQPVAIVAHSMGGLVARSVIENERLDPKNVQTLVMLGTPNRGSDVASLRCVLEAYQVLRDTSAPSAAELGEAIVEHWRDGLGEAGGDLLPGSVFLQQLGARPRNPRVRYHLVLGTRSFLTERQLDALRDDARRRLGDDAVSRLVRPRLERWLADLDELVTGKGDGAVSVAAGALDGVSPLLVPLDHRGLVCRQGWLGTCAAEDHPVFPHVADWIAQCGVVDSSNDTAPSRR